MIRLFIEWRRPAENWALGFIWTKFLGASPKFGSHIDMIRFSSHRLILRAKIHIYKGPSRVFKLGPSLHWRMDILSKVDK